MTAEPNTGYHFTQWSDGGACNPRLDTNVTTNTRVTAIFEINRYTVTFQTDGTSSASLNGMTAQQVDHGSDCSTVTAQAAAGWFFIKWKRGDADYSSKASLTVTNATEDMTLTAIFSPYRNPVKGWLRYE